MKHDLVHIRHNGKWDVHQCQCCYRYLFTLFARGRRDFEFPGGATLDKPTKAARRCGYTLEQSHWSKTDPYEDSYRVSREYGCPGVPFALGVSPPIVIGAFKRRTPQANGTRRCRNNVSIYGVNPHL